MKPAGEKHNDLKWNLSRIGLRADLILKKKRDQQMWWQKEQKLSRIKHTEKRKDWGKKWTEPSNPIRRY